MNNRTAEDAETSGVIYSTDIPKAPGYYVYRLWIAGECVYVGRVGENGPRPPQARLNHHRRMKSWWPEVTRIEMASLPDLPSIIVEERAQIADLRPRYNRQRGNCSHDLSLPGATDPSNGRCRACVRMQDRERNRRANMTPEQVAKGRQKDRRRQPLRKAARQRRTPSGGQGGLW